MSSFSFVAHVFFDDAFEGRSRTANQFVHNLITVAQDAARYVSLSLRPRKVSKARDRCLEFCNPS